MKTFLWKIIILNLTFTLGLLFSENAQASQDCVLIFYDQGNGTPEERFGEVYSIQLRNILGHFPEYKQIIIPIESYQAGMINSCGATVYLGTNYFSQIPEVFYYDVRLTEKPMLWIGYSIWNLDPVILDEQFGIEYEGLTTLDNENRDQAGDPGFFRNFHYLGEVFTKYLGYEKPASKQGPLAAYELTRVAAKTEGEVLSWAEHSGTGEQIPYVTRKNNFFYVADIPFSYIHEADRYLIFCDILFDFLNVEAKHPQKLALVRIEDVHPLIPVNTLAAIKNVFDEEQAPMAISFVPVYAKFDPPVGGEGMGVETIIPFTEQPDFLTWVREAKADGVHFILHGVTHHLNEVMNPIGKSGVDYEFWNIVTDESVSGGNAAFTLDRLDYAYEYLASEDMHPITWITPHYLASPTDYRVLAKVFPWQIGRVTYSIDQPTGEPTYWTQEMLELLQYRPGNTDVSEARQHYFQNYRNQFDNEKIGQFFPYEIYGDFYGQRVIPESLGNVTPKHLGGGQERTIDQILEDAKRNLVLRDTWASVFYHPFLLNSVENGGMGEFDLDGRDLRRIIRGIKELGYKFISIDDFVEQSKSIPNVEVETMN